MFNRLSEILTRTHNQVYEVHACIRMFGILVEKADIFLALDLYRKVAGG